MTIGLEKVFDVPHLLLPASSETQLTEGSLPFCFLTGNFQAELVIVAMRGEPELLIDSKFFRVVEPHKIVSRNFCFPFNTLKVQFGLDSTPQRL